MTYPFGMKKYFLLQALIVSLLAASGPSNAQNLSGKQKERSTRIRKIFDDLRTDNVDILNAFYAPDSNFVDPIVNLNGLEAIKGHYAQLYQNVKSISFEYSDEVVQNDTHVLLWTMKLQAEKLNSGQPIAVIGNSYIKFNSQNLVSYHRDYFDMGEFIYEHIPVLGYVIGKVKKRLK